MKGKKKLKLTLIRSVIGILPKHKECVKALGLRHTNHSVVVAVDPCTQGIINKVNYLLLIEDV